MFTNPYSGKFDLMQGVQQILPMLLQYAIWKELKKKDGKSQDYAKGMASMMPDRGLEPAPGPMGAPTTGGMASMMPSRGLEQAQPMGTDEPTYKNLIDMMWQTLDPNNMPMRETPISPSRDFPPNLSQQAPSSLQGQPFSPGASQGVPIGADMSRINQMLKMKQMMGTDQQQMPPQMPQQQGGNLMQLLPLLMSLL